jgi:predicted dehydrogenase
MVDREPNAPIRVGVVGLGLIAQAVHLPNLATLRSAFRVTRVCDVSAALAAAVADQLPGDVVPCTDWRDLVGQADVDAVLVLTPGSHTDLVLAALQAGKHVLAEKPLGYSVAAIRRLAGAATDADRVLQVGYMKLHDPLVARAREHLDGLGELRAVRVTVLHPDDECQFAHVARQQFGDADAALIGRGLATDRAELEDALGAAVPGVRAVYENVLLGSVIHEAALLRGLGLGLPDRLDFVDVDPPLADPAPPRPPRILAVGRLPGGAQLQLSWNWLPDHPEYREEVLVLGEAGRLTLDLPGPYLPAHRSALRVERTAGTDREDLHLLPDHSTAFVRELEAFAGSVRDGAPVVADAAGAAADVAFLQALVAAAARREGLPVSPETETVPAVTG